MLAENEINALFVSRHHGTRAWPNALGKESPAEENVSICGGLGSFRPPDAAPGLYVFRVHAQRTWIPQKTHILSSTVEIHTHDTSAYPLAS